MAHPKIQVRLSLTRRAVDLIDEECRKRELERADVIEGVIRQVLDPEEQEHKLDMILEQLAILIGRTTPMAAPADPAPVADGGVAPLQYTDYFQEDTWEPPEPPAPVRDRGGWFWGRKQ